ncbi:LuxR C-terminal-related transcriptional regulator [Dactylosporangium salmoneum]|uniref:HTH luxR-type domain-containing protein n=1 Tax=Dactylosporangium salmoneum TaxID=53361 RepID=A0ABN3G0W5_9ACTN
MSVAHSPLTDRALRAIGMLAAKGLPTQTVVEEIVHRVVEVVHVEAFFVAATDPLSGLCLGAGMAYNLSRDLCHPYWEHELQVPDYNKFVDLGPGRAVADLREATGGRLSRSPRFRVLNRICDLEDELRAVFHAGGRTWGILQLNRKSGGRPFSAAERTFVSSVAPLAGKVLRAAALTEPTTPMPDRMPGILVLGADGKVLDATTEARAWLEDVAAGWRIYNDGLLLHPELLNLALAAGEQRAGLPRRARLRTRSGLWLTAQVSPLTGSGNVAVMVQPAKASEMALLLANAYGLTSREIQIAQLISRGRSTDEIAKNLCLSPHTIRDHVKAILDKVDVTSRGGLTSKLYFEQHFPLVETAVLGALDRVRVADSPTEYRRQAGITASRQLSTRPIVS